MPFALVIFGLIMVVTAAKGTHVALGNQLAKDFTGDKNFIYWIIAIIIIAAVGRVPQFEKVAKPFLVLVIMSMLISNRGFFEKFMQAIKQGPVAAPRDSVAAAPNSVSAADAAKVAVQVAPYVL